MIVLLSSKNIHRTDAFGAEVGRGDNPYRQTPAAGAELLHGATHTVIDRKLTGLSTHRPFFPAGRRSPGGRTCIVINLRPPWFDLPNDRVERHRRSVDLPSGWESLPNDKVSLLCDKVSLPNGSGSLPTDK